jgi:hypothetical protein
VSQILVFTIRRAAPLSLVPSSHKDRVARQDRAPRKVILSPADIAAAVLAAEAGAVGGAAAGAAAGACAGAVRGAEEAKDDARKIEILTELLALEKKKDKELAALSLEQHRRDEQLLINEQVRRRAVERHTRFCVI